MDRKGLCLAEVLVVLACMGLLSAIAVPSLSAARDLARRSVCASQMHQIGLGLSSYAAVHKFCMPPFQFSDPPWNLPASGHWGGASQSDPMHPNPVPVNLWCLVAESMLTRNHLLCPAAPAGIRSGQESLFPNTSQFSTYCLRFPPSPNLFDESPHLANYGKKGLLGIYLLYAGGQKVKVGAGTSGATGQTVPLVRLNRRYPLDPDACFGSDTFDPAADTVLSDEFWWQARREPAPTSQPGLETYPTNAGWCHGRFFNVLSGGGSVQTIGDDGTVAANSVPPDGALVDSGLYFGKYAERVWQYFDRSQ